MWGEGLVSVLLAADLVIRNHGPASLPESRHCGRAGLPLYVLGVGVGLDYQLVRFNDTFGKSISNNKAYV